MSEGKDFTAMSLWVPNSSGRIFVSPQSVASSSGADSLVVVRREPESVESLVAKNQGALCFVGEGRQKAVVVGSEKKGGQERILVDLLDPEGGPEARTSVRRDEVDIPKTQRPREVNAGITPWNGVSMWRKYLAGKGGKAYPHLRIGHFETQAPQTTDYNCIAWSARHNSSWKWPGDRISDFDAYYRQNGFLKLTEGEITDADLRFQPEFEKAVLYAIGPDDNSYPGLLKKRLDFAKTDAGAQVRGQLKPDYKDPIPTHAIVQDEDGIWSSKMGSSSRLRVAHPNDLAGDPTDTVADYGKPIAVYVRERR